MMVEWIYNENGLGNNQEPLKNYVFSNTIACNFLLHCLSFKAKGRKGNIIDGKSFSRKPISESHHA
jgi:hypothetical protein